MGVPTLCRLPLAAGSKRPLLFRWSSIAPDDDIITRVFHDNPRCGVGLRLDQFVVVDCDSPERVTWWLSQGFPTDFQSRGNPERRSFWYRLPEGVEIRTKKFGDWEIRSGTSVQCVIPPSIHPDGWKYEWLGSPVDEEHYREIPEAPVGFLEMFRAERLPLVNGGVGWDVIEEGGRDNFLTALAGLLRAKGASVKAVRAGLAVFNRIYCEPMLPSSALDRIANSSRNWQPDIDLTMEDDLIQAPRLLGGGPQGLGMAPPTLLRP